MVYIKNRLKTFAFGEVLYDNVLETLEENLVLDHLLRNGGLDSFTEESINDIHFEMVLKLVNEFRLV